MCLSAGSAVTIALLTPGVEGVVLALVGPGDRARGSVRLGRRPVDADLDTGVLGIVGTGELDGWAGSAVAVAGDLDLSTADAGGRVQLVQEVCGLLMGGNLLELGTAGLASAVKAEMLGTEEVFTRRSALRQGEGEVLGRTTGRPRCPVQAGVGVDVAGGQRVNLEPITIAQVIGGSDTAGGLAQVHGLGTGVAELRVDIEAELVAGRDGVGLGRGADGGVVAALVADNVGGSDVLDGRVGVGRAADVLVGAGDLAVDDESLEVVVGEHGGDSSSNGCKHGVATHLCGLFAERCLSGLICSESFCSQLQRGALTLILRTGCLPPSFWRIHCESIHCGTRSSMFLHPSSLKERKGVA